MSNVSWRDDAACLGMDPDLFDVEGAGRVPVEGLRVCQRCEVRADCLAWSVENITSEADTGVWGGTTVGRRNDVRWGRSTLAEAMAAGDELAEGMLTDRERLERDEPWLEEAIPVAIRPYHRPDSWSAA